MNDFFKNILAGILRNNLNFFQDCFQDYHAKILKLFSRNLEKNPDLELFQDCKVTEHSFLNDLISK